MRLRLRIERNELPPTQILHSIPSTQTSQTIAQFLQNINVLFPLESTNWDISDYAVLVGGYEATHYTEVGQAFKDEDEVVIKPLGFAELRARSITGRDQISEDGRHLLDGIPFGRPMLKRPRRPEVNIPARKRQRVEDVTEAVREEEWDDEDDEDFEDGGEVDDGSEEEEEEEEDEEEEQEEDESEDELREEVDRPVEKIAVKSSAKSAGKVSSNSSSDSSEDDSDSTNSDSSSSGSDSDSGDSDSGSGSGSDSSSASSSSASEASWDGIDEHTAIRTGPAPTRVAAKAEVAKAAQTSQNTGLPKQGDPRTKERNTRRRDSKKLKHLKNAGLLPQTATLQDMYTWQRNCNLDENGTNKAIMESERKKLLDQIAAGGVDITSSRSAGQEGEDDDEPPEEESSRPNKVRSPAVEVGVSDAASTQIITEIQQAAGASSRKLPEVLAPEANVESHQAPAAKRARLDTKSMKRLVFGSLGLGTPKTQEDREAVQKKLAARPKRVATATPSVDQVPELIAEEEEDPDSWRDKIVLTAVECVDADVTLTAPPFPFQQRWDPQYQFTKKRKTPRGRKSGGQSNVKDEPYDPSFDQLESARPDKYNQSTGSDALNYDDDEEGDEDDESYWEEGALLGDDDGEAEDADEDIFPPVPADITSLPPLAAAEAKTGDFIIYQELSVSAATSWQPKITAQVAHIECCNEDGSWTILLKQNRPKEYAADGTRIYSKFEMENFSDDGNDEKTKRVLYAELQDPRLLHRPMFDLEGS